MKKTITLITLMIVASITAQGQVAETMAKKPKAWKAAQINLGLGVNWYEYNHMSFDKLRTMTSEAAAFGHNLDGMTEEASNVTAGGAIYASISLSPWNTASSSYHSGQEMRLGMAIHSDKEAMVSFKNEDLDTSIVFCNLQSELALEGSYIWKGQWGKRWMWHVGAGVSLGATYGNQMMVLEGEYFDPNQHPSSQEVSMSEPEIYDAKNAFYTRIYIPAGIHYKVSESMSIGIDIRKGRGLQMMKGEKVSYLRRTGAFILSTRYIFAQ